MNHFNNAVDGPAGAGKAPRALVAKESVLYIADTGATVALWPFIS